MQMLRCMEYLSKCFLEFVSLILNYYMASYCSRYNARSDWLTARALFSRNAHGLLGIMQIRKTNKSSPKGYI